jgi:hypothetical protein
VLRGEYVASFERALRQSRLDVRCRCETIEYAVDCVAKARGDPAGKRSIYGGPGIQRIRCQLYESQRNEERAGRNDGDRPEKSESTLSQSGS